MTHEVRRPAFPRRKVLYAAAATLLAFAEVGWGLPAEHAPHASLAVQVLVWLGLALTVLFTLLAAIALGRRGERGWVS